MWVDQGELRAGNDWRHVIDQGITDSFAVLLALSADSAKSSYVTYEWASAMGKGKPIIPVRLNECQVHPKLEAIQYLDFSITGQLPWHELIEHINLVEHDNEVSEYDEAIGKEKGADDIPDKIDPYKAL